MIESESDGLYRLITRGGCGGSQTEAGWKGLYRSNRTARTHRLFASPLTTQSLMCCHLQERYIIGDELGKCVFDGERLSVNVWCAVTESVGVLVLRVVLIVRCV